MVFSVISTNRTMSQTSSSPASSPDLSAKKQPEFYQAQHKKRLSWMPWLYFRLKAKHLQWAEPWQAEIQQHLMQLETVELAERVFISPDAALFAEPGRAITLGEESFVAANCFLHGPLTIGREVAINHGCSFDGGKAGIVIGDQTRIANQVKLYAFDHGMAADLPVYQQSNSSKGIVIGKDVWIGAGAGVRDGITINDHAVVAMNAMVTRDVPAFAIVAGNPARIIGDRREKPVGYREQIAGNL